MAAPPPTTGKGLCEACNHIKEAYGWRSRPADTLTHLERRLRELILAA